VRHQLDINILSPYRFISLLCALRKNLLEIWLRKYEIYAAKSIPLHSYSKTLYSGVIFMTYISYFVDKINI
jgi:hypothetical protein